MKIEEIRVDYMIYKTQIIYQLIRCNLFEIYQEKKKERVDVLMQTLIGDPQ